MRSRQKRSKGKEKERWSGYEDMAFPAPSARKRTFVLKKGLFHFQQESISDCCKKWCLISSREANRSSSQIFFRWRGMAIGVWVLVTLRSHTSYNSQKPDDIHRIPGLVLAVLPNHCNSQGSLDRGEKEKTRARNQDSKTKQGIDTKRRRRRQMTYPPHP